MFSENSKPLTGTPAMPTLNLRLTWAKIKINGATREKYRSDVTSSQADRASAQNSLGLLNPIKSRRGLRSASTGRGWVPLVCSQWTARMTLLKCESAQGTPCRILPSPSSPLWLILTSIPHLNLPSPDPPLCSCLRAFFNRFSQWVDHCCARYLLVLFSARTSMHTVASPPAPTSQCPLLC